MILIIYLAINVSARVKWREVLQQMNEAYPTTGLERTGNGPKNWGRSTDNNLVHWTQCPPIDMPNNMTGVQRIFCDSATCVVDCEPGFNSLGNNRANCRVLKGKNKWTKELPECGTCIEPAFKDDRVTSFCYVERGTNQKVCELRCNDGISKLIGIKVESIKCSCERSDCFWRSGRGKNKKINLDEVKCQMVKKEVLPDLMPCENKEIGCTDVTEDVLLSPTWSCPECLLLQSTFNPSNTFDHRDHIKINFPSRVEFLSYSYPIRSAEKVSETKWILYFHQKELISMNRQGNWKVNWSAELKYFGELNVQDVILQSTTVETCPCE